MSTTQISDAQKSRRDPSSPQETGFRRDIQGLRAVAVSAVFAYHLWPHRLTGGYVGVDVFFVISGFLITTHLVKEQPRRLSHLASFWARRARRLLPASFLVLLVTMAASRLIAPETQWASIARGIGASALYAVNWTLAASSVDYLAADNAASPVQHYWSLAVEEQFYLVWPVLVLLAVALASRTRRARPPVILAVLTAVTAVSFVYSVYATAAAPTSAYFVTTTRMWELGVGGVTAVVLLMVTGRHRARPPLAGKGRTAWRSVLALAGVAAVAYAIADFSAATPFPGWRAAAPVLGTAAVIAAGTGGSAKALAPVLENRAAQWLGDVSYSVYLWHWPLIALVPYVSGGHLGGIDKLAIVLCTLTLAGLTKVFVEDRFRARGSARPARTFALTAVGMALVIGLSALVTVEVGARQAAAVEALEKALAHPGRCFGANALARDCPIANSGRFVPALAQAAQDRSLIYSKNCLLPEPFRGVKTCTFGDPDGDVSLAVVGNSHAAHWMGPIEAIAKSSGWKVTTFLAASCTPSTVVNSMDQWHYRESPQGCLDWAAQVEQRLRSGRYDAVVLASSSGGFATGTKTREESMPLWIRGYRQWLAPLLADDVPVVVIRDTPWGWTTLPSPIPDCLAEHRDDFEACGGPRETWVREDPLESAAESLDDPDVRIIDMNDFVCGPRFCPPVVGGVIVYQDGNHLTNTYAMTLAPYLAGPLTSAVSASVQ